MSSSETDQRRIADRYLLTRRIGAGGMGVVWEALDELLDRRVAIKVVELPATVVGEERARFAARVLREARAAARLNHPGAVTLYDVVREDATTYIVMELVDARSLDQLVQEDGPLEPHRAARLGLEVLAALGAAHTRGIVHRDVKPANVLVLPDGQAKLTDFGIATLLGDPKLTSTGTVIGSPAYMAPEQASGEESGPQADLYGLGATLYYAVEGEAPYAKGAAIPTLAAVVGEPPRPMRRAGALGGVIERLMVKDPAARPTGVEARRLLTTLAGEAPGDGGAAPAYRPPYDAGRAGTTEPVAARAGDQGADPSAMTLEAEATTLTSPGGRRRDPARLGRARVVAGALLAAVLVAGGTAWIANREDPGGDGTTTSQPPRTGGDGRALPAGWTLHQEAGVYELAYPEGWTVRPAGERTIEVAEPGGGVLVRVQWVAVRDQPADANFVRALGQAEAAFAAERPGYRQLSLGQGSFTGRPAVTWEYQHGTEPRLRHGINHLFVESSETHGFTVGFETPEADWAGSAALMDQFHRHFRAVP